MQLSPRARKSGYPTYAVKLLISGKPGISAGRGVVWRSVWRALCRLRHARLHEGASLWAAQFLCLGFFLTSRCFRCFLSRGRPGHAGWGDCTHKRQSD